MKSKRVFAARLAITIGLCACGFVVWAGPPAAKDGASAEQRMLELLDAPLLFTKRHSYSGIHIYDTYYKWPPGGGGIYILENPSAPRGEWKIRPVIDPTTPETLGLGVYDEPELSWDATRLLFTFKGEPDGNTCIYEIGIDGRGLRRVSDPTPTCDRYKGSYGGQHDLCPAYLPDGRIVCLSTRPSGLVPCNNTGVAILHVMNRDGSDMHPISVNNVNEFDPAVLPDGRLLFGRWEYVDKNALTIQSLWTVNPDGTQETALFANNMVFPEALLDARPIPGSHLVVATLSKHNSTPRGSIAVVDPRRGKDHARTMDNLEHPEDPTFDRGDSCEPWPVTADVFLLSGRQSGQERNAIEMIDRQGHRLTVLSDPEICLHSPMLVKPRPRPVVLVDTVDRQATTGRFFVQDIYQGLAGVRRGEVKYLRVVEETSRVSEAGLRGNPFNQTFLISAALAFSAKNFLGVVPVEEDGSAYFEVPAGRAVYLQALDGEGRLVQSMRTFVQAAPGTTRSCVGCHEYKYSTVQAEVGLPETMGREPRRLQPESWGTGYLDYPSMVQPVLDRRCVRCHGGCEGIAAGMDLSGGWTEYFNISYENLANRVETQLEAYWIAGIDCMNGTALWSSKIFRPRAHGSGTAPLAKLLVDGHDGHISDLTRPERDLLMAWIDTNGAYYGTWNYTASGCKIAHWTKTRAALVEQMKAAGCLRCHGNGDKPVYFENDWINLQHPEQSRLLRAPLAEGGPGNGLAWCRRRPVDAGRQRIHLLWKGYAHAVQPPEAFPRRQKIEIDRSGDPVASFASPDDPAYQAMLAIIRQARRDCLANPRVDMPEAKIVAGECRALVPPPLPETPAPPRLTVDRQGVVHAAWELSAQTIGLAAELHRADRPGFTPTEATRLVRTPLGRFVDGQAPTGQQHYALVFASPTRQSRPAYAAVDVPPPAAPPRPVELAVVPASCTVRLVWRAPETALLGYHVYRARQGSDNRKKLTTEPVPRTWFSDATADIGVPYTYTVRAMSRRGIESEPAGPIDAVAQVIYEPMFVPLFEAKLRGRFHDGKLVVGRRRHGAQAAGGVLDLAQGGYATFAHDDRFDLAQPFSLALWVRFDERTQMPVIVSCGYWKRAGWFLQWLGNRWRWHVGGVDCDGGRPAEGRWIHLAATSDGRILRLYEDGLLVAEESGDINPAPWPGELYVGQYSGQRGAAFQMIGQLQGLEIYHRPLSPQEVAKAAEQRPE